MNFNGHQLVRNHVDLPLFSGRYLRILFQATFEGQLPNHITGLFPKVSLRQTPKTTTVEATRISDQPEVYNFNSGGFFPAERIQIRLAEVNSLIKALISSRANTKQPWRHRTTAIFYRLKIDGAELENVPVAIPMTQDSLYRMEILAGSLPKKSVGPELLLM